MGKTNITRVCFRYLIGEITVGTWILGYSKDHALLDSTPKFLTPFPHEAFAIFKEEFRFIGLKILVTITYHWNDLSSSCLGFF
jgi:hypothetical protein